MNHRRICYLKSSKDEEMSTIAAISTAPGIGGIGIIRMSGEETYDILEKMFIPKHQIDLKNQSGYTIKYGHIVDNNGQEIDEVLVSFFRKPNSYTAEDLCEISSHGGIFIVRKILELCLKNGAILAEPGEFTKRAFLNGRIDLSQAEAVIDIINAKSEKEADESIKQLEGHLSKEIQSIREILMSIMVDIEVSIDYPEYDVEEVNYSNAKDKLNNIREKLRLLENSFENGKIIKEGIKVALIGKPNVGKSSLLNAILKEERAIVTEIEGTTRDIIEEAVIIKGIPITIVDTAGIRKADDKVEQIGIERSEKSAKEADVVIALFDLTRPFDKEDEQILEIIKDKKSIVVINKADIEIGESVKQELKNKLKYNNIIEISAKTENGIDEIYNEIERMFNLEEIRLDNSIIITNVRHKQIISQSIENVKMAIDEIDKKSPIDIVGMYVKQALEELGNITGETVSDEIIKEIFAKFCLGK